MQYILPNSQPLIITIDVLKTFHQYRQKHFGLSESGGILLGNLFKDHLEINQITIPDPQDKRGPFFFHRNRQIAQTKINEAFHESEGKIIYIGEWHTHYEVSPKPSLKDKVEIKRALKKSYLNLNFIILVIVGSSDELGCIWTGYQDSHGIKNCTPMI